MYIEYLLIEKDKYPNFSQLAMNDHLYRRIKKYNTNVDEIKKKLGYL